MLESEAREREKARLATETDDRARNTHIFDVLDSGRTPGSLTVAPGTLSFEVKKSSEKSARKNVTIQCPEIRRVEQGQSAFVPPHVNLYLSAINGKDRELLFYTSSGGQGLFVNKAIVDITSDVINAIIQACRMTRVNK
jgi:hypothetical protein